MAISKITARALNDGALDQANKDGTGAIIAPSGTTAQRPSSPSVGMLRYNSTVAVLEQYTTDGWVGIEPAPTISSFNYPGSQTAIFSGDSIDISGTGFKSGAIVKFQHSSGTITNADSTTRNSSTSLTAVFPTSVSTEGTYSIIVTNPSGLGATLDGILTVDGNPIWSTSSGSLGSFVEQTSMTTTIAAAEDGNSISTFALQSGTLPTGVTLNTSTGVISGTPAAVSGDTTYSFTVRATDSEGQHTDRSFSILVSNNNAPVWITTSGSLGSIVNSYAMSTITVSATVGGEVGQTISYSVTTGSLPTGLTLNSSSGVISGTPTGYTSDTTVSFTITASDGIDSTSRSFSIEVLAADASYSYSLVTINADGTTNNGQNASFVDSSSNAFTLASTGNAAQGSFSPFSVSTGAWSYRFNNNSAIITPSTSDLQMGTGDFTVEFFVNVDQDCQLYPYWTGLVSIGGVGYDAPALSVYLSNSNSGCVALDLNTQNSGLRLEDTGNDLRGAGWKHIAVTRQSGTIRFWVDGSHRGSGSYTGNMNATGHGVCIGATDSTTTTNSNAGNPFTGYISNLRVIKGTALYTGSGSITVPTSALTAVSGTVFLGAQDGYHKDNSTVNQRTFTQIWGSAGKSQDTRAVPFSPFRSSYIYTASSHGGSVYLDNNGDSITLPDNSAFDFGSGDYTVEAWVYPTTTDGNGSGPFLNQSTGGAASNSAFYFAVGANGGGQYLNASGQNTWGYTAQNSGLTTYGVWNHIACVRQSGTLRSYINGVQIATGDGAITINNSSRTIEIGAQDGSNWFGGYISSLRVVKGTCLYNNGTTFSVPTAPLTTVSGTSLLCNFTNGNVIDVSGKSVIETASNAKITTSNYKYGTGSVTFNGTSDYIIINSPELGKFRSKNFTVEFWAASTGSPGNVYGTVGNLSTSTPAGTWRISTKFGATNALYWMTHNGTSYTDTLVSNTNYNDGTWRHFAISRNGTTLRIFVNGSQVYSGTDTLDYNSNNPIMVGAEMVSPTYWAGQIDDLRIYKGVAKYTTTFTPPTRSGGGY